MNRPAPRLITFDVFGTIVDWRTGLRHALRAQGQEITDAVFNRIIDVQSALESGPFASYAQIVADSLVHVLGLDTARARAIGDKAGEWPLFADSRDALRRLLKLAPCAAMTNSDLSHRAQVEPQLGFALSDWLCAEEARVYKPSVEMWKQMSQRSGFQAGSSWWHVSAYADYDLETADRLGLTCVFVRREHARPGHAHVDVKSLVDLVERLMPDDSNPQKASPRAI